MTERADISLQENQTLDIYDEFDKIYDQDDETLLIASIMDLAFLEVLGDLGEESRQSVIGEWVPDEAAGLAFSIPENADTWYRRIREKVASWPSQKVANALKERLPNNGREFCEAIQYCRKKSKAEDIKLNVKQFLKDATIIGGFGVTGQSRPLFLSR